MSALLYSLATAISRLAATIGKLAQPSRNNIDWDYDLTQSRVGCKVRLPSSLSSAGPSIFLRDVLLRDVWKFLRSLEIDLSGIAGKNAMQEWLRIAEENGPQLRLKTLLLHRESPFDGLQDVTEWRGQYAAEYQASARGDREVDVASPQGRCFCCC